MFKNGLQKTFRPNDNGNGQKRPQPKNVRPTNLKYGQIC